MAFTTRVSSLYVWQTKMLRKIVMGDIPYDTTYNSNICVINPWLTYFGCYCNEKASAAEDDIKLT